MKIRLHWNHLLLQTNIFLSLHSAAGRKGFFCQVKQFNNFPLVALECYFSSPLGSLSLKKGHSSAATCAYLKGRTDKLLLKGILEQYRPALEILGLLHVADGGGIIHCQTFRSSFVEIHNVFLGLVL